MPASDLWRLLQELPRPHKLVDFPRTGPDGKPVGQLAIQVLTQEEQMAANAEAEKVARTLLKDGKRGDLGYEAVFNNEGAVQVVLRACRDANDVTKAAFPGAAAIRAKLTADEVGMLFDHYLTVQLQLGPIITEMSDVEFEAWVTRLDEGQAFFFDRLSSETKKTLVLTMASRLRRFSTDTYSAGSLPDEGADESSPSSEPPLPSASETATAATGVTTA
jgi:hypothetical protein